MTALISQKYKIANQKFDGIIEAVRFQSHGRLELARFYERRGATYSDHLLITRDLLVQRLKKGEKFAVGKRLPFLAGTFEIYASLKLDKKAWGYQLATTNSDEECDIIDGAPLF